MKGGERDVDCGWSYPVQDCKGYGSQEAVHCYKTFVSQWLSWLVPAILALLWNEIGHKQITDHIVDAYDTTKGIKE